MATKIISCSFEPGSMGGFITICNGVNFGRPEHFSKTIGITKEAFIAACKDRVLFNDLLGIDIRTGWQNALAAAIEPFKMMKEDFDADIAAKVSSELDVKLRGEDAVKEDIEKVEKENAKLEKATKKAKAKIAKAAKAAAKPEKPAEPEPAAEPETPEVKAEMEKVAEEVAAAEVAEPEKPVNPEGEQGQPVPQPEEPTTEEVKDESRPVETTDNSSEDTRSQEDSGLSSDGPRAESAE